jgi:hypothetical protein
MIIGLLLINRGIRTDVFIDAGTGIKGKSR